MVLCSPAPPQRPAKHGCSPAPYPLGSEQGVRGRSCSSEGPKGGGGEENETIKLAMELYKSVKMLMDYHLRIVKNYCSAPLFSYGEVAILANDH